MDDIQILVLHSRGVHNFMDMILVAYWSFIVLLLCILKKKWFQILAIFCNYVHLITRPTYWACTECIRKKTNHSKSGTFCVELAVNKEN